jgi:hypothetical protein
MDGGQIESSSWMKYTAGSDAQPCSIEILSDAKSIRINGCTSAEVLQRDIVKNTTKLTPPKTAIEVQNEIQIQDLIVRYECVIGTMHICQLSASANYAFLAV